MPLKNKESKDQKNSKVTMNYHPSAKDNNRIREQFSQALDWSYKKNSCLNRRGQQSQFSHTLANSSNITVVKKNKKLDGKNLSRLCAMSRLKKATISPSFQTKSQKTSVGCGNHCVID